MTFLQTGIRLSELAGMRLENIDFENRMLTVRQGLARYPQLYSRVGLTGVSRARKLAAIRK